VKGEAYDLRSPNPVDGATKYILVHVLLILYSNVIHPTPLSHQLQNATHNMRWLRVLKDVAGGGIKALSAGESDSSDEILCYITPIISTFHRRLEDTTVVCVW
jgi:hypothetical protein